MKTICFLVANAILLLAGCQPGDKSPSINKNLGNISIATLKTKFSGLEPLIGGSSIPSISNARIHRMSEDEMKEMSHRLKIRRAKLAQEATIPVLKEGEPPKMSLEQAQKEYASFLNKNKDDKMLISLFTQSFAPLILNEYGLLNTNKYESIYYYLNELVTAPSNDFETMTLCVAKLQQSQFPKPEEVDALVNKIVILAEHRYEMEQKLLPRILSMNENLERKKQNKTVNSNDKLLLIGANNIVNTLKNSDAKTCIEIFRGDR